MSYPGPERLADLLRHAAETLRTECEPRTATPRGVEKCTFNAYGEVQFRALSGPLVSDLIRDLECAAFALETRR